MQHPKIRPIDKKVLVLPILENASKVIAVLEGRQSSVMQKPTFATVIRVGPEVTEVKEGDTIMMPVEDGKIVFATQIEDRRYVFVHENTIAGVVTED